MNINSLLPKEQIKQFEKIDSTRAITRLIMELSAIFALIYIGVNTSLWLYPLVILGIASRQHALLVLMHECAHGVFVKSKLGNNIFGEFIGWNHFMLMRGYRRHHTKHHVLRNINTMKDPDFSRKQNHKWVFPMRRSKLVKTFLMDVLMLNTYELVQEAKDAKNNKLKTKEDKFVYYARIFYCLALFGTLVLTGNFGNYLLFWIVPAFSFLKLILRIRSIADHFHTTNDNYFDRTRTIEAPLLERLLIAPCNIGVHNEHHIFAKVPYYNLLKLRKYLMQNETYRNLQISSPSYYSTLFRELSYES